ncbi:phosphatidylserine decarboxylase-domain-containing protein [Flagelloscypha sp. PMI_526]|nr:phosphatidylserine decarboxylase-domain-containing protein [Flagelloscypha sp. PMI_526]
MSEPPPQDSKFKRLLKVRKSKSNSSSRNASPSRAISNKPVSGEVPVAHLKLTVVSGSNLIPKDKNGLSDPFCVITVAGSGTDGGRKQTGVVKKSLNPSWNETFTFPLYKSLAPFAIEITLWDKDMMGLKKDYMGEVYVPISEWFPPAVRTQERGVQSSVTVPVASTRAGMAGQGEITLHLTLERSESVGDNAEDILKDLIGRSDRGKSVTTAAPTRGIGTIRRRNTTGVEAILQDDGLSSDSDSDDEYFSGDDVDQIELTSRPKQSTDTVVPSRAAAGLEAPALTIHPASPLPPSSPTEVATPKPPATARPTGSRQSTFSKISGRLSRRSSSKDLSASPSEAAGSGYTFGGSNDIVGICMLEIVSAEDLPRLKNMTRTGWDMDPFVVISFGKKVFRTRVIRHSRNPTWEEKLLFHVRKYETGYNISFAILDWDKMSSNDHIGDITLPINELVSASPQPDPTTGLYKDDKEEAVNKEIKLKLIPGGDGKDLWEGKHSPMLTVRARYQPYAALRQKFWRQYLREYDTDDTGTISHLELTSMLDSLGSTLSRTTVESFYTRYNLKPHQEDLTIDQAVVCLEEELLRPDEDKKKIGEETDASDTTGQNTPFEAVVSAFDARGQPVDMSKLDFSGPAVGSMLESPANPRTGPSQVPAGSDNDLDISASSSESPDTATTPGGGKKKKWRRKKSSKHQQGTSADSSPSSSGDELERVINVKNCPLCHRPRLSNKAEVDIVTHLAVCASQDWNKVDRIVTGNFVTASQAQRKWYTKVLGKISSGDYKVGANSANILVQNRMTGQLEEEKMQVFVRLGIRLLYKGMNSRMEGGRARKLLKSLSIKQGVKYDDPLSAADIPGFIEFHNLDKNEILDPLDSFKNFNQFFYRKLKATARPVENPDDPYRIVSAADCRFMSFETVSEATRIWIKGREFSVARLLGEAYKDDWAKYDGGGLAIFRLAPQDYHRFHTPVDGVVGKMTKYEGEYYTVNPQAIRTALDVYGDNVRKIVPIDSPQFGRVMAVCIGAMMVGTIVTTVEEGQSIKRGDEFGYFAFGGSTIVMLLEKGVVQWDEDLLNNGKASLETLVRVGMGIGKGTRK